LNLVTDSNIMSLTIHQIHYLDTAYERAKNIEYVNKQTYVIRG
jgi:hypothetical protein